MRPFEATYLLAQADLQECFRQRRYCYDEYRSARRDLELALSTKGGGDAGGLPRPAPRFAEVSELMRLCRQVDTACVEALGAFAREVIARARSGCR